MLELLHGLSPAQWIALRLLFVILMASLGAVLAVSFKKINHMALCVMISFAAGALLSVALFDIFPEAIEMSGWVSGIISIASGYLLFWIISRFVSHICPACSATHAEINFQAVKFTIITALSIHSFMDGLAIYGASVGSHEALGLTMLIAVAFHKFPEGLALTLVARGSGLSRTQSFGLTAVLEGVTTLAGGFVGFLFLLPHESHWVGLIMGHVGGGFVFIVIHALLSEMFKHHPLQTILSALLGCAMIFSIGHAFGSFVH